MKPSLPKWERLCGRGKSHFDSIVTPARLAVACWLCALTHMAEAVHLTWNPSVRDLNLSDAAAIKGVAVTETAGTLVVALSAGGFDPASSILGVTYDRAVPALSSVATIIPGGDCHTATLSAPIITIDRLIALRGGDIGIATGPDGSFAVDPNGSLVTTSGGIAITADAVAVDGPISALEGTVALQPASPGRHIELGGAEVPSLLELTRAEIGWISAATLSIGGAPSGFIFLTADIAPAVATLSLRCGGNIVQLGGAIKVAHLELEAPAISLNRRNTVATATLLAGTLSLDCREGPALSGNLVVGGSDRLLGPAVVQWFEDDQLNPGATISTHRNGTVDLNSSRQTIGGLQMDRGEVATGNDWLRLNGNVTIANLENSGATITGYLDLGGGLRTLDVGGPEDYINLTGDLTLAADLSNGGFAKAGPGTLVLSGDNVLELPCLVTRGSLLIDGILHADLLLNPSATTVEKGITLTGSGLIDSIQAGPDCQVVPGDVTGRQSSALLLSGRPSIFGPGSSLAFIIKGAETSLLLHTNFGIIDLSGFPELTLLPYDAVLGITYTVISSPGGSVSGQFKGLSEGAVFQDSNGSGQFFQIHYAPDAVTLKAGYPTTNVLAVAPRAPNYGDPLALTATVTRSDGGIPTGVVVFKDSGSAIGSAPLTNGVASFTISTLFAGVHDLVAEYPGDDVSLASSSATNQPLALLPQILSQPTDYQGILHGKATFTVSASGTDPLFYQWRRNGETLAGGTNSSLVLNGLKATQAGDYDAVVANAYGSVTSLVARLTVSTFFLFGDNRYGQSTLPSTPVVPSALALGWYHSVALLEDGTVSVFGDNSRGQFAVPKGLGQVTAISAGAYHSLALTLNGTVVAWGFDAYGQTDVPAGLSNVVAISAGAYHNLALRNDGTVAAWGYAGEHQCDVPPGLSRVRAVAAGLFHSLALLSDGTVVAWGNNSQGQGIAPPALTNVTAIAAGSYHNMAILADGTLRGWGNNRYGQLDQPAGLDGVTAVAAGDSHTLALRNDGTVLAWGHDPFRQLEAPPDIARAVAIAASGDRSLILGSR